MMSSNERIGDRYMAESNWPKKMRLLKKYERRLSRHAKRMPPDEVSRLQKWIASLTNTVDRAAVGAWVGSLCGKSGN